MQGACQRVSAFLQELAVFSAMFRSLLRQLGAGERVAAQYAVVPESLGVPDPLRLRYRESLGAAIWLVVREGMAVSAALNALAPEEEKAPGLKALLTG